MENYQYEGLSQTKRQIRIFTLLPSPDFNSALQGRLQVVDFDSNPPYEALSYVWGSDASLDHVIDISGSSCSISAHLANILKHIRQSDTERDLWIDAVCIDQKNMDEKGRQVKMMGDVYRNCKMDLAWLENPGDTERDLGIDAGRKRGGVLKRRAYYPLATLEEGLDFIENGGSITRYMGGHPRPEIRDKIEAVFGSRLWSRVWIVQELSCAKDVLLLGGKKTLKWSILRSFLDQDLDSDVNHWHWGRALAGISTMCSRVAEIDKQRYLIWDKQEEHSLFDVLARFCERESTKPVDRVYGLLGLVSPHCSLEADYKLEREPAKVFAKATEEIIRQSQNLDILCQSPWERRGVPQCSRIGSRTEGLPSWAVDFNFDIGASGISRDVGRGYRTRELMFAGDKGRVIFSAGGDLCEGSWRVLDGTVLQLRGYLLGQIGPPQPQPPINPRRFRPGVWGDELTDGIYEATGEPKFQALWRTMVTDCKGYKMERLDPESIKKDDAIFHSQGMRLDTEADGLHDDLMDLTRLELPAALPAAESHSLTDAASASGDLSCAEIWWRIERNWAFYVSEKGLFIMARKHVQEGDHIAVIEGAKVPLILQSVGNDRFEIVSPAYVHGYMDGDAPIQRTRPSKRDIFVV